jgi:hypothetical protein
VASHPCRCSAARPPSRGQTGPNAARWVGRHGLASVERGIARVGDSCLPPFDMYRERARLGGGTYVLDEFGCEHAAEHALVHGVRAAWEHTEARTTATTAKSGTKGSVPPSHNCAGAACTLGVLQDLYRRAFSRVVEAGRWTIKGMGSWKGLAVAARLRPLRVIENTQTTCVLCSLKLYLVHADVGQRNRGRLYSGYLYHLLACLRQSPRVPHLPDRPRHLSSRSVPLPFTPYPNRPRTVRSIELFNASSTHAP